MPSPEIAKLVGKDAAGGRQWLIGGKFVDDDGLQAVVEEQWQREYGSQALLDRELGLSTPESGRDVMAAAESDLAERGIRLEDATEQQLFAALKRVSP